MVTIIADEGQNNIGEKLYEDFLNKGIEVDYVSLKGVEIKPCVSCGACTYKTYRKCIVRDDGDWIYPKCIKADALIFVTPITFGSYSFKIKRVFDKFGLIMDEHYYVKNGEIVKGGKKGGKFKFFAIGINENCIEEEIKAFKNLVNENLIITRGTGNSYIVDSELTSEMRRKIIEEVLSA